MRFSVPDCVIGTQSDPVRNGSVLPHLLGQLLLDHEGLVRRLHRKQTILAKDIEKLRLREAERGGRKSLHHFRCGRSRPRRKSCRRIR